jgi:transposase
MGRYELSDAQWARIAPLFPQQCHPGSVGRPPCDHRPLVVGILWVLHTGAPWRDLPECYGPWQTVFTRFNGWRRDGTWVRIVTSLLDELDDAGLIDHDLWCIDGTVVRASRSAAGARKRGGATRADWVGATGRKWRSLRTMPWAVREAGSGPRSIWSATATASSWRSTSRPARRTRVRRSSRRWPIGSSIAAEARAVGRTDWRETRVTVTRGSGAGAAGGESRRSSRRGRISRATSDSSGGRTGGGISSNGWSAGTRSIAPSGRGTRSWQSTMSLYGWLP